MGMWREEFAALVVERLREGPEAMDGKGRSPIVVFGGPERVLAGERASQRAYRRDKKEPTVHRGITVSTRLSPGCKRSTLLKVTFHGESNICQTHFKFVRGFGF